MQRDEYVRRDGSDAGKEVSDCYFEVWSTTPSLLYILHIHIDLPPVLRLQNLIWGQWQPSSQLIHATHTHTSWQSAGSEWPRWDWFSCRTDNCVQFTPASSIQGWLRSHFLFTITLLIQSYNLEHYSHTHPHSYISISLDSWQTVR